MDNPQSSRSKEFLIEQGSRAYVAAEKFLQIISWPLTLFVGPLWGVPHNARFRYLGGIYYGLAFYGYLIGVVTFNRAFLPPQYVGWFEFLPLILLELTYRRLHPPKWRGRNIMLAAKLLLMWMIFYFWALSFMDPWQGFGWMPSHVTHGTKALTLFIYARPTVAIGQILFILLLYWQFWVRRNRGSFVFGVLAYPAFLMVNYMVFYTTDLGGVSILKVENQARVEIIAGSVGPCDLAEAGVPLIERPLLTWVSPFRFPRALYLDKSRERLYLSYGTIWPVRSPCPNFYSVNTAGGGRLANLVGVAAIREFQPAEQDDSLYLSAWGYDYRIHRVSRDTLEIEEEISFEQYKASLKEYDVYDISHDKAGNRIFVITGIPPSVIRYDIRTKETKVLNLADEGITEFASILHTFRFDRKRNLIVITAVTGDQGGMVITVDPDTLRLVESVAMPSVVVSVEFDPLSEEIMVGDGLHPRLYFLNANTLEMLYQFETPSPCIRRMLPLPDRNSIMVVDHLLGKVDEIDRYNGELLQSFWVGNKPIGMQRDGNIVYVASTLGIVSINLGAPRSDTPSPYLFPDAEQD
jgi:hypothetical protein